MTEEVKNSGIDFQAAECLCIPLFFTMDKMKDFLTNISN